MSKIINNPFYAGVIEVKKTNERYSGIHEPIISQALFDRAQGVIQGKVGRKVVKHEMLFRRMFRCERCGYSLVGETHKNIAYYRCHTADCATSFIRESKLSQAIVRQLKRLEFTQEEKNYFRQRVLMMRRDGGSKQRQTIQSLELQLKQVEERLDKLTDAYLDRAIDKESFERRKTTLLAERRSTQDRLTECTTSPFIVADKLEYYLERAGNAYLTYQMGSIDEKRELVNILTSNREVDKKSVKIMLDFPFNLVAERLSVPGGSTSQGTPRTWDRVINKILKFVKTAVKSNPEEIHAT
jgi:hypothetical protein